jgi:hypothetical protein
MKRDLVRRFVHAKRRFLEANLRFRRQLMMKAFRVPWDQNISVLYTPQIRGGIKKISQISQGLTLATSETSEYGSNLEHHFVARNLISINNALIDLASGNVFSQDETDLKWKLVNETSEWPIEARVSFARTPKSHGKYPRLSGVYLNGLLSTGHYHRITEDIPTLLSLPRSTKIIAREKDQRVLEQFGMSEFKIVKDCGFVEVERLEFISKGNDVGYLHPTSRTVLLRQSELDLRPKSFRNIYLTREDLRRSIRNERDVVQLVQSKGFEIIDPAALSIREQISLFSEAKLVIAPHGGAITNMIYSKEASLLEVMPRERINRCFEWQSLVCSHDYAVHLYSQKEGVDLRKFTSKIENWVSS